MTEPHTYSLRYRPQTFDELFDQEHIKRTLTNAIQRNRLAHAYLFAGPRGVGKTTTARIFAKCLNCDHGPTVNPCNKCPACLDIKASKSLDVLEIDGASNRGIDNIRELRETVRYLPASGKHRIYIVDEVHMLTKESFNAFLKTLEEPPQHVVFIFATTEPHKVLPTILSRCQRFDFKRIPLDVITERLQMIIKHEGLDVSEDAVKLIGDIADGGLRDAESILEQITTFKDGRVEACDVTELMGIVPHERFKHFMGLIREGDEHSLLGFLETIFSEGYDVTEFYFGFVGFLRALLFSRLGMEAVNKSFPDSVLEETGNYHAKELVKILGKFLSAEEAFKRSLQKIIFIETLALSLIHQSGNPDNNNPAEASTGTNATQPSAPSKSQTKKNSTSIHGNNDPASKTPSPEIDTSSPAEQSTSAENQNPPVAGTNAAGLWREFLAEISSEESFVSFTLKDSILLKVDGSNLEIGIQPELAHQIGLLEDNVDDLEMKLSRIARKKMHLMFKAIEGQKGVKPIKSNHSGAVDDVLDIFKGEIVR